MTPRQIVLSAYPEAVCKRGADGEWWVLKRDLQEGMNTLGYGPTRPCAWRDAKYHVKCPESMQYDTSFRMRAYLEAGVK